MTSSASNKHDTNGIGKELEDDLFKRIVESKNVVIKGNSNAMLTSPEDAANILIIDKVFSMITDTVANLNNRLGAGNVNLQVIRGIETPFSNRKSMQLVLKEPNTPVNLLEAPYLLVEGFVNNGDVRFVSGGSVDPGKTINVAKVSPDLLRLEISNFLQKSIL